ncbi:hypothetical protein [Pseudomonas syringae group genomosp. 3]|uniref:hypothetical protein n=1 Tax=Pseudomonas syringae group genomosp. 3 TaxID=251701 RepID=UPI0005C8A04C|nr:hypothetical protein [Pseudomonas syringae group genomosp. 3]KPX70978.1 Uncharacterized protein ALO84_04618 [Pseudomonas syringae pv. maculicola]
MTGTFLKTSLCRAADEVARHHNFERSIESHYATLLKHYNKRPFFYKRALQFNRLLIAFSLLSHYFTSTTPLLSQVRDFCAERKLCSHNSIQSIFLSLRVLGFIDVTAHALDARLRVFKPTDKACKEVRAMIASVIDPLADMGADSDSVHTLSTLNDYDFLAIYFRGFSELQKNNVTIDIVFPECHWLIKKEAGHMLILAIYLDARSSDIDGSGFKSSSYLTLGKQLSVSKTHVMRLIQEGVERGYFKAHPKNNLEVLPAFETMVRRFMSLSFAVGLHCMNLN